MANDDARSIEEGVARHYAVYGVLDRIREGLASLGRDPDHIAPEDLKAVDEFHIGGGEATVRLLDQLGIGPESHVLDIGSGIGGPARTIARRYGARVTGIDLTPEFVDAARALSRMCGTEGSVSFVAGSATDLPFPDDVFDVALLLHVGMNIPDKPGLFAEAARVVRPGGTFAVYDVMKVGPGELQFPVPWAETADLSALAAPQAYREAARAAGLTLRAESDRSRDALDFFARIRAAALDAKPAPLGLHQLMGPTVGLKTANMIAAISAGVIAPTEMLFSVT
jgi:SAM-dependent methyltransferase